jgi:hydroxymethylbilane synthase
MTMLAPSLRVGTRASRLAVAQTAIVVERLRSTGVAVEVHTIETDGDRRALDTPWGEGAFVAAIERALLAGDIDVAVHSAKDVPTDEDPRLRIAAFLPRERPEDVLVVRRGRTIRSLADLPAGARVGTDSPRRTAFLRAWRPDLVVHPLHGNVDTRLRRLDDGGTDALVLAAAGLIRLGQADRISAWLPTDVIPPAPGQGALAVQVRADDPIESAVARLDDAPTRRAVLAERQLLAAAGGGCRAPLGAHAMIDDRALRVRAGAATPDGAIAVHVEARSQDDDVEPILVELADAASARARALGRPTVIVTRARERAAATVLALVDRGFAPLVVSAIRTDPRLDAASASELLDRLETADWVVVTSRTTVDALVRAAAACGRRLDGHGARWAAIGPATERALAAARIAVDFRPDEATAVRVAETLPVRAGTRVALPGGDLADPGPATTLARRGATVEASVVYGTTVAPDGVAAVLAMHLRTAPPPVAVVVASPSAVRGWLALAEAADVLAVARSIPLVPIGPTTANAVADAGLTLLARAADPTPGAVADAVRDGLRSGDPAADHGHAEPPTATNDEVHP